MTDIKALTFRTLARFWHHLTPRRQRQFSLLTILMLVGAFAELASLSAVFPFLGVLTAPSRVLQRPAIAHAARALGIASPEQLVLPLTALFVAVAVVAAVIRTLTLWVSTRLAFAVGADLSTDAYNRTLFQPYPVHVGRNSSEVISGITSKVHDVVFGVLVSLLTLISSGIVALTIILALIIINPRVAFAAAGTFGICYWLISRTSGKRLRLNSERIAYNQTEVLKALQEGLGGIRDVLLSGTQSIYREVYHRADYRLRRAQGSNVFISQSPRFAMEAVGMVLIAVFAYELSRRSGGIISAIPMLGALALGAQRLLPSMQQSHSAWENIKGHQASLIDMIRLLDQPILPALLDTPPAALAFETAIQFERVRFRYSNDSPWVLDGLNFTIKKGERVGVVGITGSGKSTALDLLMGLLMPTEGVLLIDGQPLSKELIRAWQKTIAHVPQSIFLADATIAENIAFGLPPEQIELPRLHEAAQLAQIADFIESAPEGYQLMVGERGIRLSGGQRQRIGIARALYKQADLLVFDEATSALDSATEQSVIEQIEALSKNLTIVIIAHRLSTVRRCDRILELDNGRVAAQGSYDELLGNSPSFRRMANA